MNELQEKEFELLKLFVGVCEKLNLKYYLVCGSALGAVKYEGFIPWDDDIDVALPRHDYEIFCDKAQGLLPSNIFVQNYKTDKFFPLIGTKLRNLDTTYIEKAYSEVDIKHGVFIDVFPLDGLPANKREIKKLEKKRVSYTRKMIVRDKYDRNSWIESFSIRTNLMAFMHKYCGWYSNTAEYVKKLNQMFSKYSIADNEYYCNYANSSSCKEYALKTQYGEGIEANFEGLTVRIPENYEEYLLQKYGEWRKELPIEKQYGHHFYEVCDLRKPYTEYIQQLDNGRIYVFKKS